jgi:hypothetical protein
VSIDKRFDEYFAALERSGDEDRCYLCRRSPAEVKSFFGFSENGTPLDAERYGIEDVVLEELDIMSYRGERPVCAVCQLNFDALLLAGEGEVLRRVLAQMEHAREALWPARAADARATDAPDSEEPGSENSDSAEAEPREFESGRDEPAPPDER